MIDFIHRFVSTRHRDQDLDDGTTISSNLEMLVDGQSACSTQSLRLPDDRSSLFAPKIHKILPRSLLSLDFEDDNKT